MKPAIAATLLAAAIAVPVPGRAAGEPVVVLDRFADAGGAHAWAEDWRRWADDFRHELRSSMGAMFAPRLHAGKVVTGAPYSADVVTETRQALADGNEIHRRKVGAAHRDGAGRTRQETPAEGAPGTVYINDPVANRYYVLTPGSKRAGGPTPRVMSFTNEFR
ncbi:MAG TPA: hypothetical protein VLC53_16705, partial [Myxococcota bacterium]|nr:hypothetical protein [Myxococcota bacterium]